MKVLTYLFMIGSMTAAFGQHQFSVAVQVAPVFVHADSKINFPFADQATGLPTTEIVGASNGLSYLVGVTARYGFSPKWSATTGLWAIHTVSSKANISQNGILYTIRYRYNHPFSNLYKIPLLINYLPSAKRLSPYLSAGATFDFRGTSYVDLNGNGEYIPLKLGKSLVISPLLGIGIRYGLSKHLSLIAQPTIQYNIESHPSYSYYHLYQLSLQTQLLYRF